MPYIIGLNSGSSFDGLDAVLCTIDIGPDGHPTPPKFIDALTVDWPDELQQQILRAFENNLSLFEMARLNYAAGALYAEVTNSLLAKAGLKAEDIDVVGYDGQTIYQEPPDRKKMKDCLDGSFNPSIVSRWTNGGFPCGMFIAESGVVAALTNITTVTQFRPVDHALGGSGAPLMQYLDFVAFRNEEGPTVTLNIGGIANFQLADKDRSKMMAFDTGPGNVMIDHVMRARLGRGYDKDGEVAASGTAIHSLLEKLNSDARGFFERSPPRSAWRLDFGSFYADSILQDKAYASARTEDIVATFTMFTATSVERALVDFILPRAPSLRKVIASGGGTRNTTLMSFLCERLAIHGIGLCTSDEVGLPAAYKEAIKFATLGFATRNCLANNIPAASGAEGFAVLGKMTFAPRLASGLP
ncbi:Anhydro-N-acetylmuramic acid kinase [Aspergillus filifer]